MVNRRDHHETKHIGYHKSHPIKGGGVIANTINNITSGEFATLSGVTGNIQEQLSALEQKKNDLETSVNDTTATSNDVVSGKTFFSQGEKQTGVVYERKVGSSYNLPYGPDTLVQEYDELSPWGGGSSRYIGFELTRDILMRFGSTFGIPENLLASFVSASSILKGKTVFGKSGTATNDANAVAADLPSGKTAYVNGTKITGSAIEVMAGNSALSAASLDTISGTSVVKFAFSDNCHMRPGSFVHVGANYLAGVIELAASKLMVGNTILTIQGTATSDANATASDIAGGKTAYVNGTKILGRLEAINAGFVDSTGVTYNGADNENVYLKCNSDTVARSSSQKFITKAALANGIGLTSSILKKGKTICGVTGTLEVDQVMAFAKSAYNYLKTNCSAVAIIPILVKSGTTLVHHQFQNKIKTLSSGYSLTTSGCSFRTISNAAYVNDAGSTTRDMTGIVPNTVGQVLKDDTVTGGVCVVRELDNSYLAGVSVSIPARSGVNGCCVAGVFATIKGSVSGSSFTSSRPYNLIIVSI